MAKSGRRIMSPSGQKYLETLTVKLTKTQMEWLVEEAIEDMRAVSDFVRKMLVNEGMPR